MEKIDILPGGTQYPKAVIEIVLARVLENDEKKWSETHVSTRGGVVTVGGDMISAPSVTSTVKTRSSQNMWVRFENGKELEIALQDERIPARAGHHLLFTMMSVEGDEEQRINEIYNVDTGVATGKNFGAAWLINRLIKKVGRKQYDLYFKKGNASLFAIWKLCKMSFWGSLASLALGVFMASGFFFGIAGAAFLASIVMFLIVSAQGNQLSKMVREATGALLDQTRERLKQERIRALKQAQASQEQPA